jgi:hypothetical protein
VDKATCIEFCFPQQNFSEEHAAKEEASMNQAATGAYRLQKNGII